LTLGFVNHPGRGTKIKKRGLERTRSSPKEKEKKKQRCFLTEVADCAPRSDQLSSSLEGKATLGTNQQAGKGKEGRGAAT